MAQENKPSNYKVGVTTGLYTIARAEELATSVRKVGFALTRGTSCIEIAGDVPHEVTETDGKEIRYIAEKQGIEILFHGSLTVPMCMPERTEWRDAQDHMMKSVRSAVYAGAKYVDFHACLNIWLELMTYAGRKLTMVFCDHNGHFIGSILNQNEDLRNWFIEHKWQDFVHDVLNEEETTRARAQGNAESDTVRREETSKQLRAAEVPENIVEYIESHNNPPGGLPEEMYKKIQKIMESVTRQFAVISGEKDRIMLIRPYQELSNILESL